MSTVLQDHLDKFENIYFHFFTVNSMDTESTDSIVKVLKVIPYSVLFTCIYVVSSLFAKDWVRAKPWLGVAGSFSVILGIIATVGFLSFLKVPLIAINMSIPFIMLGEFFFSLTRIHLLQAVDKYTMTLLEA